MAEAGTKPTMTAEHDIRKLKQQLAESKHRISIAIAADVSREIATCLAGLHSAGGPVELTTTSEKPTLTAWPPSNPEQRFFGGNTALALASHAFWRARESSNAVQSPLVAVGGVVLSSKLRSSASTSCFLALQTSHRTQLFTFQSDGSSANRPSAQNVAGSILSILANALNLKEPHVVSPLPMELVSCEEEYADPLLAEVYAGKSNVAWSTSPSELQSRLPDQSYGLLSGAFDPLHEGHIALRDTAEHRLERPVYYEVSI